MSGYRPSRRPRRIRAEEITRILSRGGMVAAVRGELCVFRTRDARRMRIGIVRRETMAELEAAGAVCLDASACYVAGVSR